LQLDEPFLASDHLNSVIFACNWQIAVEQAESVARLAGKMPMAATGSVDASKAAQVDWRELLRRAWSETIPADYRWIRPTVAISGQASESEP
jgi:predicted metal-dependent peptidase